MGWKYTDEYYKNYTRETWDECADNYLPVLKQLIPFHAQLLSRLDLRSGHQVLDVSTGPGEPALTIANMVAPTGRVVGVDLSSQMIEIAKKTASKRDLLKVDFLVMDAEKLDFPSEFFDIALSCFGFQIITDPNKTASEMFRVLKSKGRIGLTVWSSGNRVPAIDVMVGPMMKYAEPDETGYLPNPYELAAPAELTRLLEKSGFVNAVEIRLSGEWSASNAEEYYSMLSSGTPLGHSLSEENVDVQKLVREETRSNIARFQTSEGVKIPAECILVIASKP